MSIYARKIENNLVICGKHMNGRVYDPLIGRFMSADPHVTNPYDLRSFNRYSYVYNNPLKFFDPTGFDPWSHEDSDGGSTYNPSAEGKGNLGGITLESSRGDYPSTPTTNADVNSPLNRPLLGMQNTTTSDGGLGAILNAIREVSALITMGYSDKYKEALSRGDYGPAAGYMIAGVAAGILNVGSDGVTGALQKAATTVETLAAKEALSDAALVCRGGACKAENFISGSGVTRAADGTLSGVSTQSAEAASLSVLAKPFKNNQVGVTTAGEIRAAGGQITADGHLGNPNHATIDGLTGAQLEGLFSPTTRNPVPPALRGY